MPPKIKYSKDRIIEAGVDLIRKAGFSSFSARNLAAALGCTTQPIFSAFENMDQVNEAVERAVKDLYGEYIQRGLGDSLPFKGAGMQFIRFALEEPRLFEFLFMQDREEVGEHFMPASDENAPDILRILQKNYGFSLERAERIYNHLSIYTYGLAITFLGKKHIFSVEDADRMLSEVYQSLIKE